MSMTSPQTKNVEKKLTTATHQGSSIHEAV